MRVEIIIAGDELIRGRRPDRAGPLIARALTSLGIEPLRITWVGAAAEAIAARVEEARARCDALIVASVSERATRALGEIPRPGGPLVFLLPDPPPEMEAALERDVLPALASIVDRRAPSSITLRVFPRTAAEVSALVADVEDRAGGVTLEVSQEGPEVLVAIHAVAASASEARRRARRAGAEVCTRLGHDVHGPLGQDLAAAAVEALTARGWTLAAIEIGAGGAVTSQLSDVPGGDRVLRLGLALGDEPALLSRLLGVPPERLSDGVVSAPAAAALADGARRLAGAGLGLAVAALAGPSGGAPETPVGLVHFAITDRGGERLTSRRFRSLSRPVLRQWCAATALRLVLDRCREKGG